MGAGHLTFGTNADLHGPQQTLATGGHPHCFEIPSSVGFSFERCCNVSLGPEGDVSCWDSLMDFEYCCRPPAAEPTADPSCWVGALRHMHEACCYSSRRVPGPRGMHECWWRAERRGEPRLSAARCCSSQPGRAENYQSVVGALRCLKYGLASTCAYPGVAFRPPGLEDRQDAYAPNGHTLPQDQEWPAILWAVPRPRREDVMAHFVTLGVGDFASAAKRLHAEASVLGLFAEAYVHTDFSFLDAPESDVWARHLTAWQHFGARIAGFGWWKPALCRRYLASDSLPARSGLLVYSDAGSRIDKLSAGAWRSALVAMQRFDVLAIVEPEFAEHRFTKIDVFERFSTALAGSLASIEGQFITGLIIFRKTPAAFRLIRAWEYLVADIGLVDETADISQEHRNFVSHRHEQSVWSLLVKCAILGREIQLPGEPAWNITARVLTMVSGYESRQLSDFARARS